jgi:endonuclease/exonuclease/phosphatase family metal-dependent hydrolase
MNTRTCEGRTKLGSVLDTMEQRSLDILCVQECRFSEQGLPGIEQACRKKGIKFFPGKLDNDSRGHRFAGVAIFAKCDAARLALPDELNKKRVVAITVARPQQPNLVLTNVYLPASDRQARTQLIDQVFAWQAGLRMDAATIGDFNMEQAEWPLSEWIACGKLRQMDDADPNSVKPTTNPHKGKGGVGEVGGKRVIDFGVYRGLLKVNARGQHQGVADHHLITYDIDMAKPDPRIVWPGRLKLSTQEEPLEEDEDEQSRTKSEKEEKRQAKADADWTAHWMKFERRFAELLADSDTEAAWKLLSDAVELLLCVDDTCGGARRGTAHRPRQAPRPSTKTQCVQSLKERQLRAFTRRVEELQQAKLGQRDADGEAVDALSKLVKAQQTSICKKHPELQGLDWEREDTLPKLQLAADTQAANDTLEAVDRWRIRNEQDEKHAIKWIKLECDGMTADPSTTLDPQRRAKEASDTLRGLWTPKTTVRDEELDQFMQKVEAVQAADIAWDGTALRKICRKSRGRAAGADAWLPSAFADLGIGFFEALARLWKVVWETAKLPESWKHVRVVSIPKEDGGLRPLSIAAIGWRLGMTLVVASLREWYQQWIHTDIAGGLSQRSAAEIHDALFADIEDALSGGESITGLKVDIQKCFDSVSPRQAARVLQKRGAPPQLMPLIAAFYEDQQRWVEWQGCVHPSPIVPTRSLLQGCPLSPLLLAAIMTVWHQEVDRELSAPGGLEEPTGQGSSSKAKVYIDDRTLWSRGPRATEVLERALEAGAKVDKAAGMIEHPGKRGIFASTPATLRVAERLALKPNSVSRQFVLLGVSYDISHRDQRPVIKRKLEVALKRCVRIRMAVRARHARIRHVRSLVLPLMTWRGAWNFLPKQAIESLTSGIERAVYGTSLPGRSRFIVWDACIGAECHPMYALCKEALRTQTWRAARRAWGKKVAGAAGSLHAAMQWLGWRPVSPTTVGTQDGILDITWDGTAAMTAVLKRGWRAALLRDPRETRAADEESQALLTTCEPSLATHRKLLSSYVTEQHALALGCAIDGRILCRDMKLENTICAGPRCSEVNPSRAHLTWTCSDRANPALTQPRCQLEERLCVPLVPRVSIHPARTAVFTLQQEVVEVLRRSTAAEPIDVATDGGAEGNCFENRNGSWGVATAFAACGGLVEGLDHSSTAAEFTAALIVMRAAVVVGIAIRLAIDNATVQRAVEAAIGGAPKQRDITAAVYRQLADLAALLPQGCSCYWVPSHGKKLGEWTPPAGVTDDFARALNKAADAEASKALVAIRNARKDEFAAREHGNSWSRQALQQQSIGIEKLRVKYPAAVRLEARPWSVQLAKYGDRGAGASIAKARPAPANAENRQPPHKRRKESDSRAVAAPSNEEDITDNEMPLSGQ